jgi:O-antigen/teichoic acid export membrane protein
MAGREAAAPLDAPATAVGARNAAAAGRGIRLAELLGVHDAGRLLRDFATYLPSQLIPAIAGFLALPILARELFPTELGVLAIAQTLVTLGWTIVASWFAAAIVRELPAHRESGNMAGFARVFRQGLALVAVGFAAFTLLLYAGTTVSAAMSDNFAFIVAATAGLVVQNIAVSLAAAGLRPRTYAIVEVGARVGGIALGVALVFQGYKIHGYLAGLAIASAAVGVVALAALWPRSRRRGHGAATDGGVADVSPWLRYGIPASAGAIVAWLLMFVDRYILALLEDAGAVGIYTIGNVIGDKSVMIPMFAFFTASVPLLVTAFEKHGRTEVERLMRAYTRVVLLVGVPCIAYIAAAAGVLVPLITARPDYKQAATVAPIVAIGSLLFALGSIASAGLVIEKRTRPLFLSACVGLTANVLANFALIPPFGVIGAAIATPIGMAANLAAAYLFARGYATWRFPQATLWRVCAAAGLGYLVALESQELVPPGSPKLAVAAATGFVAYVLVLWVLGERRASEAPAIASA